MTAPLLTIPCTKGIELRIFEDGSLRVINERGVDCTGFLIGNQFDWLKRVSAKLAQVEILNRSAGSLLMQLSGLAHSEDANPESVPDLLLELVELAEPVDQWLCDAFTDGAVAREWAVMRELCEAALDLPNAQGGSWQAVIERFGKSVDAYRALRNGEGR